VRAGADARAVAEGRVFVGRQRAVQETQEVRPGDDVFIASPASSPDDAVNVLVRTGDLVAADKPAGIPTIADHGGATGALVARVARALGVSPSRVHPTSRLDRDVSGVVVFSLTGAATRRLTDARARGAYERRYVAIASREPAPERGTWDAPIGRAADPRLRAAGGRDAVPAQTRYAMCGRAAGSAALLAVAPLTGRTHQIRVHAATAGAALVGDRAYGGPTRLTLQSGRVVEPRRVALHAARVVVPDENGRPLVVTAAVPPALVELWSSLGGDAAAWELSTSCALG